MRIAINGFGRIGRSFLRALLLDQQARARIDVVAINIGPSSKALTAHLFEYDTLMKKYPGTVLQEDDYLIVDEKKIKLLAYADPKPCCWGDLGIDWVVDCSGKFTKRSLAEQHLQAGARAVLISAPMEGDDITIIPGVNQQLFNAQKHKIISLGSCTTNALMPLLKVLYDSCSLENAWMTTMHAYTNSQVLIDVEAHDARLSRAAALNIIPTSTGAQKSVAKVMPELAGKVHVMALRVPVALVSILELVCSLAQSISVEHIHEVFTQAEKTAMKNIIQVCSQPLVSSDFIGNSHSVIIDSLLTHASERTVRLFGWYDNEWAYSMRMKDFLMAI